MQRNLYKEAYKTIKESAFSQDVITKFDRSIDDAITLKSYQGFFNGETFLSEKFLNIQKERGHTQHYIDGHFQYIKNYDPLGIVPGSTTIAPWDDPSAAGTSATVNLMAAMTAPPETNVPGVLYSATRAGHRATKITVDAVIEQGSLISAAAHDAAAAYTGQILPQAVRAFNALPSSGTNGQGSFNAVNATVWRASSVIANYHVMQFANKTVSAIKTIGKWAGVAGLVISAGALAGSIWHDVDQMNKGNYSFSSTKTTVSKTLGGLAGATLGGAGGTSLGAWIGGLIGTAILPGAGTAGGAMIGGALGELIGGLVGGGVGASLAPSFQATTKTVASHLVTLDKANVLPGVAKQGTLPSNTVFMQTLASNMQQKGVFSQHANILQDFQSITNLGQNTNPLVQAM
jgi:hypothetical protein